MVRVYLPRVRSPTVVRFPPFCSNACMPIVLIADDDPGIRALLEATLGGNPRLEIVEARDGIEALDQARRYLPAVMLLGLDLLGVNGSRSAGSSRCIGRQRTLPIHGEPFEPFSVAP